VTTHLRVQTDVRVWRYTSNLPSANRLGIYETHGEVPDTYIDAQQHGVLTKVTFNLC